MKRKICCFLESFELGGIESLLTDILTALDTSGLEIDVVAARITKNAYSDKLESLGVRFIELSGGLRSVKNFSLFQKLLRTERYDAVHFNIFHGLALVYVKIAEKLGVPTRIVHAHGAGLRKSKTRPMKMLLHRFCKRIFKNCGTHYIACSAGAAKFLFGDTPCTVIKNGIKTELFTFSSEARARMREVLGVGDETLIGQIGRLSGEKNQAFAIEAFAEYVKINPRARLVLIGDGPTRAECESLATRLGVGDSVYFAGNRTDTPEWLSAMDVFLFPSIVEGFGIAAIEAQASGLYTLASDALPPEARVTERFISLPADEPIRWAMKIAELPKADERETYSGIVKLAGCDISDSARSVISLYRGGTL